MTTRQILENTNRAKADLCGLSSEQKNDLLVGIASSLEGHVARILEANALDMQTAKGVISDVMLDRLALNLGQGKTVARMLGIDWLYGALNGILFHFGDSL